MGNERKGKPVTDAEKEVFLDFLAISGNVKASAKAIDRRFENLYKLRKADPDFREKWEVAVEEYKDAIEAEMHRRGVDGVDKPIFYQGKQISTIKEYSDQLLMKMAEGWIPEKYGKQRIEHTGKDGEALQTPDTPEIARRVLAVFRDAMQKGEAPPLELLKDEGDNLH